MQRGRPHMSCYTDNTYKGFATARGLNLNNEDYSYETVTTAYGTLMPSRSYVSGTAYRFGYQGQFAEKDQETGFNAFEARMWDARIGRWMNPDRAHQHFSYYMGMGNNPISFIDLDGYKDKPFKSGDKAFVEDPNNAETSRMVNQIGPSDKNYNCHSWAWSAGWGDRYDPDNFDAVSAGYLGWDNTAEDEIERTGAIQLDVDQNNTRGDRVEYYIDNNNKWDKGEFIAHSAIVSDVDKDGNTTSVMSKCGAAGISDNHPNAPGFYDDKLLKVPTKRAYFRIPDPRSIPQSMPWDHPSPSYQPQSTPRYTPSPNN